MFDQNHSINNNNSEKQVPSTDPKIEELLTLVRNLQTRAPLSNTIPKNSQSQKIEPKNNESQEIETLKMCLQTLNAKIRQVTIKNDNMEKENQYLINLATQQDKKIERLKDTVTSHKHSVEGLHRTIDKKDETIKQLESNNLMLRRLLMTKVKNPLNLSKESEKYEKSPSNHKESHLISRLRTLTLEKYEASPYNGNEIIAHDKQSTGPSNNQEKRFDDEKIVNNNGKSSFFQQRDHHQRIDSETDANTEQNIMVSSLRL